MEKKQYVDGPDKIDTGEELVKRTKEYIKAHPDAEYFEASNIILQSDAELAKAYANNDGSRYTAEPEEKLFIPAEPEKKMSEYRQGLDASKEIARKSEILMLERDLDYITAQKLVLKKHPELLKAYCLEVIDE